VVELVEGAQSLLISAARALVAAVIDWKAWAKRVY
jgi:hypothetical protein